MTTKEVIQHPTTANIKLLAIGAIVGLFAQHSVDLKEQVAWLNNFLGSEEFKAGLVGLVGVVAAVQQAFPKLDSDVQTFITAPPITTNYSVPSVTVSPANPPTPAPKLDLAAQVAGLAKVVDAIIAAQQAVADAKTKDPLQAANQSSSISSVQLKP